MLFFFFIYWCVVLAATYLKYRLSCLPFICTFFHYDMQAHTYTHACVHTRSFFFSLFFVALCSLPLQVSLVSLVVLGIHLALSFIMTCRHTHIHTHALFFFFIYWCVVLAATTLEVSFVMLAIHLHLTCRHTHTVKSFRTRIVLSYMQ